MAFAAVSLSPFDTSASDKAIVSVYVDGEQQIVSTDATTVSEVLRRSEIPIAENDIVEPALDEEISNHAFNINIYRARPAILVDGNEEYRVRSAHASPRLIAEAAEEVEVHKEDRFHAKLVRDIVWEGHAGVKIEIERATPIELTMDGRTFEVRVHALMVAQAFEEAGLSLGEEDQLNVPKDTPVEPGMKIAVTRIGRTTVSLQEPLKRDTEVVLDNNRPVGYEKVRKEGADGIRMTTFEVVTENGREVRRNRLHTVVLQEAENRVVVRGNKPNYTGGPLNEAQITFLGNCESGMTPTRNSGNGFYGAFQFMPATWRSVNSEYDMPHHAPLAVQIEAVQTLLSRSSIYTQFPSCARQMDAAGLL